jgi:crossover junction endodeoxyribonuclease RuvC
MKIDLNKKIFLGIDPGYADLGFGIIEANQTSATTPTGKKCLVYGSIQTTKGLSSSARLAQIYQELIDIIKRYQPELAAVEKLYFAKNIKTALPVAEARGVILLCLEQFNIPFIEFDPVQIKLAICGYGRASKPEMQKMIKLLLGLQQAPKPDDAADALALALTLSSWRGLT